MNFRSCKVLKSLPILLLSMEFLAPTLASDLLPTEKPVVCQQQILHVAKLKNPVLFFTEETDDEERREDQSQKVDIVIVEPVLTSHYFVIPESVLPIFRRTENNFDTRPRLFALYCRYLI